MSSPLSLPATINSATDLAALDEAATRFTVPCGDGVMVVRAWGEGQPVVLLHGGAGSWNHWVRNIPALVTVGRRVWVPDLPGFGESAPPPAGNDADALTQPVEAGLQCLLGSAACDLVGFSFGSMVAAFIAARYPQHVRRLILVGAPALGVVPANPLQLRPWAHLPEGPQRAAVLRANLATLMLARPESIDEFAFDLHYANLLRDRMRKRRLSQTDVLLRTLPDIRCPVFGIWGEQDALYRGRVHLLADALRAAPDFRWLRLIPASGHWVQFEDWEMFDRALTEALSTT
jgi:2-hydroxy-6-oxonona-2,4-dienedioate hydrolase